ncbi:MAG: hypothetical protein HYX83_01285 [Chloroflexi bacterium]|nr:hypothetical protein [Chloroflexota bacterium]
MPQRVFPIAPSSTAPFIFILVAVILLLAIMVLLIFLASSIRNTRFEVSDQGLRITGGTYGRLIPREQILAGDFRVVNLKTQPEYKPRIRTNGTGLPGYSAGWFRLRNSEKALLHVTDTTSVVYLPTNQGYAVLLSVANTEEFLQAIELWK